MDDRYRKPGGQHDYRDRYRPHGRQSEQFSPDSDRQYGDDPWDDRSRDRWQTGGPFDQGSGREGSRQREDFTRSGTGYRSDTSALDDYDRAFGGSSQGSYRQPASPYVYGANRQEPPRRQASQGSGAIIPPRQYDPDERGFFDRASDEVMSWFGDDDAARRRKLDSNEDHRGRGPANYARSSERLQEEACERLTRDPHVDASKVTVTCTDSEITLDGTVTSRAAKRRAEDIVDDISGVKHVQNNLRVVANEKYYDDEPKGFGES